MIVKICGITRLEDAQQAVAHGATAIGFVFWPRSPRYVAPDRAAEIVRTLPSAVITVGVFVNEPVDRVRAIAATAGVGIVQLHGDEPPAYADAVGYPIFRSVTLDDAVEASAAWPVGTRLLLDAADRDRRGGTGVQVDWSRAAAIARQHPVILAGGLTPDNVAEAIGFVEPYGVDVSSGVESAPGIKDAMKVARFLENARSAFERRVGRGSNDNGNY
jgi:phosphoribosylanthranilate isomerase